METPFLDHLGDARREARSTVHEWLEDDLIPNWARVDQATFTPDASSATSIKVDDGSRFRIGDQVLVEATGEVLFVVDVSGDFLNTQRGFGGSSAADVAEDMRLVIIGNAALEGAEAGSTGFSNRVRKSNYTQIFSAGVEVSGSQLAATTIGIQDELDYQLQERAREMMRDLESTVINGRSTGTVGSSSTRRSMDGIISLVQTNSFAPGVGEIPDGDGGGSDELNEAVLNAALREIWKNSSGGVDTIVVNGAQKRRINSFISGSRGYSPADTTFRDLVSVYESDFGVCRVILSRVVPQDSVVLVDSSRVDVMPLAGRSFHFKRLASDGDSERGQVIGEYTLELRNEDAHGVVSGLAV